MNKSLCFFDFQFLRVLSERLDKYSLGSFLALIFFSSFDICFLVMTEEYGTHREQFHRIGKAHTRVLLSCDLGP